MNVKIESSWKEGLQKEFEKDYFINLADFVKEEYRKKTVYPPAGLIFNAFNLCSFSDVKVVLIGQDPYHGAGQAHGLSFSVRQPVTKPPSLVNIFKELEDDTGIKPPDHGDLTAWAKDGVLLLNTVLTVREAQPNSHAAIGWQTFTDNVIKFLNDREKTIVFILWGRNAKTKEAFITNPKHKKLTAAHPSPLSAYNGFFGCKHFSKCNTLLEINGVKPVNWRIE